MRSMGNKGWQFLADLVGLMIAVGLVFVACGNGPSPAVVRSPTPTLGKCNGVLLPGHVLIISGTDVHELTCASTGSVQDKVIITGLGHTVGDVDSTSISISPDGRFLRYALQRSLTDSTATIGLQDLQTGVQHTYQISGACIKWSPSSTLVSYIADHKLMMKNLITGTRRVIVQAPSKSYSLSGIGPGIPVFGAIDCADWISDDAILFHRFTGDFPADVSIGGSEVGSNTTTLALLDSGMLLDTAGATLNVQTLSQDGKYVLLFDTGTSSWNLAKVSDFITLNGLHPIMCMNCIIRGFVPYSDELFGYQPDASSTTYKGLVFVNPQDLTIQNGPEGLPANVYIQLDSSLVVIKWGGSPDRSVVVYEYQNIAEDQDYYAVSSLQSGEVDWLIDAGPAYSILLSWIP